VPKNLYSGRFSRGDVLITPDGPALFMCVTESGQISVRLIADRSRRCYQLSQVEAEE
jgi:hypothetical protein